MHILGLKTAAANPPSWMYHVSFYSLGLNHCLNVFSLQNAVNIYRADYGPFSFRGLNQYSSPFLF